MWNILQENKLCFLCLQKKNAWFVTNQQATALTYLFVDRFWFAWHFACVKPSKREIHWVGLIWTRPNKRLVWKYTVSFTTCWIKCSHVKSQISVFNDKVWCIQVLFWSSGKRILNFCLVHQQLCLHKCNMYLKIHSTDMIAFPVAAVMAVFMFGLYSVKGHVLFVKWWEMTVHASGKLVFGSE